MTDDFTEAVRLRICTELTLEQHRDDMISSLNDKNFKDKIHSDNINKTAVHPEAGLMAVICAARSSEALPDAIGGDKLKDVFSVRHPS